MNELTDFPRNLADFEARFATEEACVAYVRKAKWPDGFRCRHCAAVASWPVAGGRREECAVCGYQESVTAGTLFHQTKKPLRMWFRAITLWVTSKRGLSAMELSRLLGRATGWLTTRAPGVPGETLTLRFIVFDEGDGIIDSAALIDNFQWTGHRGDRADHRPGHQLEARCRDLRADLARRPDATGWPPSVSMKVSAKPTCNHSWGGAWNPRGTGGRGHLSYDQIIG